MPLSAVHRRLGSLALLVASWSFLVGLAVAQSPYTELKIPALATGEELAAQPALWVMEVNFKPLRFIKVDITNPQTGNVEPKYVWYVVYRAINRPLAAQQVADRPANPLDKPVLPQQFIPEFTLVTTDGDAPKLYHDQALPEAVAAISRRERRAFKSSVDVVTDVPPPSTPKAETDTAIYGVATFVGIDPRADKYTLYMTGFSNGMKVVDAPDGTKGVLHKTIEMEYWRPGDQFDQDEPEIRLQGQPRWIYR